jgi:hypothetical protein
MFSLRTLMVVVLMAALFAAALVTRSYLWLSICAGVTVVLLLATTVAAIRSRSFVAFAVFGWGYAALTMTTILAPVGAALPTTMALVAMSPLDELDNLAPAVTPSGGSDFVGFVRSQHFRFVGADWTYFSGSMMAVDDHAEFLLVGHCGFALLLAAVAEAVARRKGLASK